ncbi:hypothetical protein SBADM41S_02000 [Streptomyces badius]
MGAAVDTDDRHALRRHEAACPAGGSFANDVIAFDMNTGERGRCPGRPQEAPPDCRNTAEAMPDSLLSERD